MIDQSLGNVVGLPLMSPHALGNVDGMFWMIDQSLGNTVGLPVTESQDTVRPVESVTLTICPSAVT
jgi:hypothetical protein